MTESKYPQTAFESGSIHRKLSMVSSMLLMLRWSVAEGLDDTDSITAALDSIDHLLTCAMREVQEGGETA